MRHRAFDNQPNDATIRRQPSAVPPATARSAAWAGYAACVWSFVFAALSFYWAAGGTVGVNTNAPTITKPVLARDPTWIAILWGIGALKVLAGLLALALVRPWGRALPRWLLLIAAWTAVVIIGAYEGVASLIQHALMIGGVIAVPNGLGETSARWHLYLWDPWWLVGGILFCIAAWHYSRWSRSGRQGAV